jgi:O-antigen ligase
MTSHAGNQALRWPSAAISPRPATPGFTLSRALPGVAAGVGALLVALAAVVLSQSAAPSLRATLAGGLALLALLTLTLARYDAAVVLGVLLLGAVKTDPAMPDAVFAVVMAVAAATGRFRLAAVPRTVRHLLAALVALNLLSAINVVDIPAGARFLAITLYLVAFGVWLAGYADSRQRTRLVVGAYLVAAVSSALLGSLALFVSFPGSAALSGDGFRAEALFQDPNVFGPFLVPAVVILLEERLRPSLFAKRGLLGSLCLLVLIAGILFSYSRAAWINLAVAVAALTLLRGRGRNGTRHVVRLAGVGILAVVAAVVLIQATGSGDFLAQRAHYHGYDSDRFAAQRLGVKLAVAHPLGVGPGQFDEHSPVSTHSLYVRTLAEQGVLGLLVLLALVGGTFGLAVRNAWRGRDLHGLSSLALAAAWCGALVNSAVVDTLHWRHLWLLAALIWATSMVHARARPANPPRSLSP